MAGTGQIKAEVVPEADRGDRERLEWLIRRDQWIATRRSAAIAIPVNTVLSLTSMFVASYYGQSRTGLAWLAASGAANGLRVVQYFASSASVSGRQELSNRAIDRHLRIAWLTTLLSGLVWALIPALCQGYTGPQTLFYLVVGCGITAGAVTHGTAYARAPIAFITPPLLSAIGCLVYIGGFDRTCLAGTMLLYLVTLIYTARQAEAGFRQTSRLKHEATAMALSLKAAHAQSLDIAEEMRHRATHDPLTGLLNRAGFLQEAKGRATVAALPMCLMLLDLDGFKAINDAFGHKAGDDVLIEVARRLQTLLPPDVTIVRLGGDEFAILYEAPPTGDPPSLLASRLIAAVGLPYAAFDAARVGVSIGIHLARGADLAEMLSCADEALYAAKSAGRNRHYLFDDILRTRLLMRRDVERDIAQALAECALEVWFQPIFGERGRTLHSLEALIRWRHPRHGWIPPAELMATAASAGFAEPLTRYILKNVCTMMQMLRQRGLEHIRVAMNISPREMSQLPVDELLLSVLAAQHLPRSMIEIEITEETALDILGVQQKLVALSEAGIRITVDDFGVGYSSLGSLRQFHVDRVKIDRCFVSGLAHSTGDQALVQAMLNLGRSLGFEVVAEGVETADDLHALQTLGCDFMQGYHLGRPLPLEESIALVARLSGHAETMASTPAGKRR
jgi:diguanylate cyclase (GGDEF)-like protein